MNRPSIAIAICICLFAVCLAAPTASENNTKPPTITWASKLSSHLSWVYGRNPQTGNVYIASVELSRLLINGAGLEAGETMQCPSGLQGEACFYTITGKYILTVDGSSSTLDMTFAPPVAITKGMLSASTVNTELLVNCCYGENFSITFDGNKQGLRKSSYYTDMTVEAQELNL